MIGDREPTTPERILAATLEVLGRNGYHRLSLAEVAREADVSRPTLYRYFPSKEVLLEAFGVYEEERYNAGISGAASGLKGEQRLEAILGFIVDFQHTYTLRRLVNVEPEHVIHQMARVLPATREQLRRHFPGRDGQIVASIVTRVALSHYLLPDDDPDLFLRELRHAAGLAPTTRSRTGQDRQRPARRAYEKSA